MLRIALLALPLTLLATTMPEAASADPVRTLNSAKTLKRACLSEAQIVAQLKRRGLRPLQKMRRRGKTYSVLAERRRGARRSRSRVVVDACTGEIRQVRKTPTAVGKFKAPALCKTKAAIVAQFDAMGYYHIQVFGPSKLVPAPAGYTGLAYSVRAWTKTPPKCPWNFAVKCSDGSVLTQTPDSC